MRNTTENADLLCADKIKLLEIGCEPHNRKMLYNTLFICRKSWIYFIGSCRFNLFAKTMQCITEATMINETMYLTVISRSLFQASAWSIAATVVMQPRTSLLARLKCQTYQAKKQHKNSTQMPTKENWPSAKGNARHLCTKERQIIPTETFQSKSLSDPFLNLAYWIGITILK
jgi:hypothetical protein